MQLRKTSLRQATFTFMCFKIDVKRIENRGESRNCSSRSGPPHGIGSLDKLSSLCLFWFPKLELRPRLLDCFGCCFIRNNTLDMIFRCASISWFQVVSQWVSEGCFSASASSGLLELFNSDRTHTWFLLHLVLSSCLTSFSIIRQSTRSSRRLPWSSWSCCFAARSGRTRCKNTQVDFQLKIKMHLSPTFTSFETNIMWAYTETDLRFRVGLHRVDKRGDYNFQNVFPLCIIRVKWWRKHSAIATDPCLQRNLLQLRLKLATCFTIKYFNRSTITQICILQYIWWTKIIIRYVPVMTSCRKRP